MAFLAPNGISEFRMRGHVFLFFVDMAKQILEQGSTMSSSTITPQEHGTRGGAEEERRQVRLPL